MNKKLIKKEISILHFILIFLSVGFIFAGILLKVLVYALPYSYPLIILGAVIVIPLFGYLMTTEEKEEIKLMKIVKK